jgi:mono/diheme cytochrome c family protein
MNDTNAGHRRCRPRLLATLILALPLTSGIAADYFNGREIYALHCQTCHGANGRSMIPGTPDFTTGDALFQTDAELFGQIREGTGTMPAYRGLLSDAEIRDVISYLRSLN